MGLGLTKDPPAGRGKARERWESLDALAQLAHDFFAAHPGAPLTELSAELQTRSALGHVPSATGVTLASLHSAKGLEWDVVFMPCLTDGALPIVYAQTPQALEEERRLLYVGLTRARELLYLSWSLAREPGGRWARQPSPFLDDLRPRTGERGAEKKRPSRGRSSRSGADR
jgi:DNA helicase-2/ATP-dependent DNA helicase PcrA